MTSCFSCSALGIVDAKLAEMMVPGPFRSFSGLAAPGSMGAITGLRGMDLLGGEEGLSGRKGGDAIVGSESGSTEIVSVAAASDPAKFVCFEEGLRWPWPSLWLSLLPPLFERTSCGCFLAECCRGSEEPEDEPAGEDAPSEEASEGAL